MKKAQKKLSNDEFQKVSKNSEKFKKSSLKPSKALQKLPTENLQKFLISIMEKIIHLVIQKFPQLIKQIKLINSI